MFKFKSKSQSEVTLPVNLQQFQDLVNEILIDFNKLADPQSLDANYFAQVIHGVIHGLPRNQGRVKKSELLNGAISMVSKHVTYHAVQQIEAEMKAKAQAEGTPPAAENETAQLNETH